MHDLVIGAAGAEAEQAGGGAGFQFGGERGQFVEQAVIVDQLVGAAHLLGHFDQALLDAADRGREPLRLGQAEQRQRAVGLDLDDALRQRAGAFGAQAAVDDQDAHEAGGVGLEIGRKQRIALGVLGDRETGAVEQPLDGDLLRLLLHDMQVERHQQRPRLRQCSHHARERGGGRVERRLALRRQLPAIGGEFGMLLPAQHGAAERDAVVLGALFERIEPAADAEIGERGAIGAGGLAGGIEGKMQDAARGRERRERPRMHLAQYRRAQGVRR